MAGMHIPEHINVQGQAIHIPGGSSNRALSDRERVMELMNVPDRIVLGGGNSFLGYGADPVDMSGMVRGDFHAPTLKELPNHLTLEHESPYPDEPVMQHIEEQNRSTSSIAIDENPLQELKIMSRTITRINTRLYQLEAEVETCKVREKQLFVVTIIGIAAAVLSFLIRR